MPWTWAASEARAPEVILRHPASYTDGRSAMRHEVSVQADRSALHIYDAQGGLLDTWPYAGLSTVEEVYERGPVRLRHPQRGDATLSLSSVAALREVERMAGRRLGGHPWMRPTLTVVLMALVLLAALVLAATWGLPQLAAPIARWVPATWEALLGERVVQEFAQGGPSCSGAAGRAALDRLTERLGAQVPLPYPLHVHVLPLDTVNAFAVPGGHIIVMRGLLRHSKSPEEFAGVLAHEIAHVSQRHPMQGVIRHAGAALILGALVGSTSSLDALAGRFAQSVVLLSYGREDELTADRIAVEILNRADIRGDALAEFLRRVAEPPPGAPTAPEWLSSHPVTAERIELIQREARGHGAAMAAGPWRALRDMCP